MLITLLYFIIFSFLLLTRYAQVCEVCEVCAVCARNRSEDEICLKVIFADYKKRVTPEGFIFPPEN